VATIREQADGVWSAFAVDEDDIGSITYDAICEVAEDAVAEESDAGDVDPDASDVDDSITKSRLSVFPTRNLIKLMAGDRSPLMKSLMMTL
jgi:hypothetical protein